MKTRKPDLYEDIPNAEYHRGLTTPRPLSSTLAKNLLRKLPAETKWELEHGEHKAVYDEGQALHELILEGELKSVVELGFDSYRTKAAREARDLARAAGDTPLLEKDVAGLRTIADTVRSNPQVAELITGGRAEVSALTSINGVPVQARYDYLHLPDGDGPGAIIDLKTVAGSANPGDFQRNAATYGYHIQAALYQQALVELGYGELPFYWLVVSKAAPYAHSLIQASDVDLLTGQRLVEIAVERWGRILKDGWPTEVETVESSLPSWIHYELEDDDGDIIL